MLSFVDLLQADIAVLEGGYSVQEALPYVNTGIILSMAGLDYNKVVEPAFDPVKYKQSQNVTAYIDDLIAKWKVQWANRHKMAEEERTGMGDIWSNRYNVYYDETGVQEERLEKVRMYENKVGWHSVLSHGQYGPYGPSKVFMPCSFLGKLMRELVKMPLQKPNGLKQKGVQAVMLW